MRDELTLTHGLLSATAKGLSSTFPFVLSRRPINGPNRCDAYYLGQFSSYDLQSFSKICRILAPLCAHRDVLGSRGTGRQENSKGGLSGERTRPYVSAGQFSSNPRWESRLPRFFESTHCRRDPFTSFLIRSKLDSAPVMPFAVRGDFVQTPGLGSIQILPDHLIGLR